MMSASSPVKSYVDEIEAIEAEIADFNATKSDLYKAAKDHGIDVLGTGPAIVTVDRPSDRVFGREKVPPFQDFRGRMLLRHMQSFVPSTEPFDHDFRLQLEGAYVSDRHFLEQYYKRLFDSGLDQKTLAYLIHQRENTAWTVLGSANLQDWYTDTQWLPRLDYYRLGDSLLGDPLVRGADVYITADLRHHPASEAREQALVGGGPALIDVSHWASEWLWLDAAAAELRSAHPELDVRVSELRTDPWDFQVVQ